MAGSMGGLIRRLSAPVHRLLSSSHADVDAAAVPSDGDVPTWDAAAGKWTPAAGGGGLVNPMTTADDIIYGGVGGTPARKAKGGNNTVLGVDGSGTFGYKVDPSGGGGLYSAYLCYQDQKSSGTNGGTFTSGAWRTRDLNTEVADTGGHGSVASNQLTLAAGTYRILAFAPAYQVNYHKLRLEDITNTATLLLGLSQHTGGSPTNSQTVAVLAGRFTLAASTVVELQHQCFSTSATNGLGVANSFGTEIYAHVELMREA